MTVRQILKNISAVLPMIFQNAERLEKIEKNQIETNSLIQELLKQSRVNTDLYEKLFPLKK